MGNHTHAATTSGPTPSASPAPRPAQVLALVLLLGLLPGLTGCGATDPAAPGSPTPTAAPTTPSATTTSGPPAMPDTARQHTTTGAKAFVRYYVEAVDYAQQMLDTAPVDAASAATCLGCKAGIRTIKRIARRGGHIEGGHETVSALRSETVLPNQSVTLTFDITNDAQRVLIPGKKPLLHPAGTTKMLMTLIPRDTGWVASELRGQ